MRHIVHIESNARLWPDPWRMVLIAICTLILCSCRSPVNSRHAMQGQPASDTAAMGGTAGLSSSGFDTATLPPMGPPGMEQGVPMPYTPQGTWAPPGIAGPWPEIEYLRDGGDKGMPAGPGAKNEILNVGMEDTVAQFDTLDGRTMVEPSNEVYIYSPRFGAVRQVVGLVANEEHQRAGGVHEPLQANAPTTTQIVCGAKQNVQLGDEISARPPVALRTKQGDGAMSSVVRAKAFQDAFKPYENLSIIRLGAYDEAEMAFLARGSTAAIAWAHTQAVQVIIDRKTAAVDVKYDKTQLVYTVDEPPGNPKLRIVKVASTPFAEPGDTVDFTIRFDNIGNQTIGNVAILDSLSTRLEFVPDSGQCSVDAKFSTVPNEGESVVVRCELSHPLQPGQGGILRFRCRVR